MLVEAKFITSRAAKAAFARARARPLRAGARAFSAKPATDRPVCYSNPAAGTVEFGAEPIKQRPNFFTEVADPKAIADAPKYLNNIEHYVGTVKLPVGLLGPLRVRMDMQPSAEGQQVIEKEYMVPMATTEGVLLASYARGAKAITQSGGAWASVVQRQMVRAPCFTFSSVHDATAFLKWFRSSDIQDRIRELIASQPHCHLVHLEAILADRIVHVHVGIDSEDAAGQNMVTYCGRVVLEEVRKHYKPADPAEAIQQYLVEGGFNSGKRGSFGMHLRMGKGHFVVVDSRIPAAVVKDVLHTTPAELAAFQQMHARSSCYLGSMSFTAHVANGLAAFYIANGQDPACVAESQGALTYFQAEKDPRTGEESLYASMTMPSLIVSTVGGGTGLPSQRACLDVIGAEHSNELAGVLGCVCLGGELSFYAALVTGEFDGSHWNATHKKSPNGAK